MSNQKTEVSEEEFKIFINNYPRELHRDIIRFCTPELEQYNDFTLGVWPESAVASISLGKSYYGTFKTKEENDKHCIDRYYIRKNE